MITWEDIETKFGKQSQAEVVLQRAEEEEKMQKSGIATTLVGMR